MTESGGTNIGGEWHGGRMFIVELGGITCSCEIPKLFKLSFSHFITASATRGHDFGVAVSPMYSMQAWERTWYDRLEPYLDPAEWPAYTGPRYSPNPTMKVVKRGRRKCKGFRNDMDKMREKGKRAKKPKYDDYLAEPPAKNRCSVCHQPGHINRKKFTCADRKAAAAAAANSSRNASNPTAVAG